MTAGYSVAVTCPNCGGPLEHVTGGRTTPWQTCALARCTHCHTDTIIRVTLHDGTRHTNNGGGPNSLPVEHGTQRGYDQHRRYDGRHRTTHPDPCTACIDAHYAAKARRRPGGDQLQLEDA